MTVGLTLWIFVRYESHRTMERMISESFTSQSAHVLNGLDRFIYERLQDIRNIAHDPVLSNPRSSPKQITKRLQALKETHPLCKSFSFFDPKRVRLADTQNLSIGVTHSFSGYWKDIEKGYQFAMDVGRSEAIGKLVMQFAAIVHDKNGDKIGVVVSHVLLSRMHEILELNEEGEKEENTNKIHINLANKEGLVLYSSYRPEWVLNYQLPLYDYVDTVKKHQSNNYYQVGDTLHFIAEQEGYLDYSGNGWRLITSMSQDEAYRSVAQTERKLYMVVLPLFLITILATLYFAKRFSRPIQKLSEATKKIGEGDLETDINIKSKDEMGMLAKNFQTMGLKLKERIEKQRNLNDKLNKLNKKYEVKIHEINLQKEEIEDQRMQLNQVYGEMERKNRDITASITYAERIQKAMAPGTFILTANFPESFILDIPRDIVSGDFYWFDDLQIDMEHYFIVAAVDCTGHGVPGGFMSILGRNLLTSIISEEKCIQPKAILENLNQRIRRILHQDSEVNNSNSRDGMDVALCVFHKNTKTVAFAGAHRPLYVLRNDEIQIIKGNSFSMGGNTPKFRKQRQFVIDQHEFTLENGDLFYLFSDGYKDQFGQESGIFSSRKFRETLLYVKDEPLKIQKNLLEGEFQDWKGDTKQTDDILIIGLKVTADVLEYTNF